ncbi:MAG: hypothetical protein ACYC05_12475 [Sulfuricella sp.]
MIALTSPIIAALRGTLPKRISLDTLAGMGRDLNRLGADHEFPLLLTDCSILGRTEELREQDRAAAIQSLVNAKRLRTPFSGDELGLVLTGTTGGNRSFAIGLLTQRR